MKRTYSMIEIIKKELLKINKQSKVAFVKKKGDLIAVVIKIPIMIDDKYSVIRNKRNEIEQEYFTHISYIGLDLYQKITAEDYYLENRSSEIIDRVKRDYNIAVANRGA